MPKHLLRLIRDNQSELIKVMTQAYMGNIPIYSEMSEEINNQVSIVSSKSLDFFLRYINEEDILGEFAGFIGEIARVRDAQGFDYGEVLSAFWIARSVIWDYVQKWMDEGIGIETIEVLKLIKYLDEFYYQVIIRLGEGFFKARDKQMKSMMDLLNRFRLTLENEEVHRMVVDQACRGLGYDRAALYILLEGKLTPVSAYDINNPRWPEEYLKTTPPLDIFDFEISFEIEVLEQRDVFVQKAGEKNTRLTLIQPPDEGVMALVPLRPSHQAIGLLYVESRESTRIISEKDKQVLSGYGDTVALTLENVRLYSEVLRKRVELDVLMDKVNTAHEEERRRIARELHDSIAQILLKIIYSSGFAIDFLKKDLEAAAQEMEEAKERARECLRELRSVIANLRPGMLEILGLKDSVKRYTEELEQESGISVTVDMCDTNLIPPPAELPVFRILQESITNIKKHSKAENLIIHTEARKGWFMMTIEDDGVGFDIDSKGKVSGSNAAVGLQTMNERAELLGGCLSVKTRPGTGTTIELVFPIAGMSELSSQGDELSLEREG